MLRTCEPCLPTTATKPPTGEGWITEIKQDGYRLIARRVGDKVSLFTKGGFDWAKRYPRVVAGLAMLPVTSVVLDGEVVCIEEDGRADFNKLHSRLHDEEAVLCAFDLLDLNGEDLRELPLVERKRRLKKLLPKRVRSIQYVEHLEEDAAVIFEHVCRMGLEGIVAKRVDSPYCAGKTKSWLKVKNRAHPALMRVAEANGWEGR